MSTFLEDIMQILREGASQYGSIRKLAEAAQMNPSTVSKWLADNPAKNQRSPNVREVGQVMDLLKVRVVRSEHLKKSNSLEVKILSEEIKLLHKQKKLLEIELEKEKAVSSRLESIVKSMVSGDNSQENINPSQIVNHATRTA